MTHDPQQIAQLSADAMWADDKASQTMGMQILQVGPGMARLSMTVTERMVNGHGLAHGGFIFSLADSALAFASSTYGQRTVAQFCSITYLSPGRLGMRLVAEARERHRGERSAIYDVTVEGDGGGVIAEFRGHTRTLPGRLLEKPSHL
jgi:acyl-CoA thioesterase